MSYDPIEGMRRRRDAARRMPPLADGRRDPDGPITDAPDENYLQILRDAWHAAGQCEEHRDGIRAQIERRAAYIQGGGAA